jgi:ketosteroid isomerase-like protein
MKNISRLYILMFLLIGSSCGNDKMSEEEMTIRSEREQKDAMAAIEEANRLVTLYLREGKFEEAGEYFATDVVQMISGQPPIRGREAWIQAQKDAAEIGDWDLELEILDFQYMGDHAVERGRGLQTFTANEDSPIPSMQLLGDYLVFWKKYPDGWQIQYDYVVVNPAEMAQE